MTRQESSVDLFLHGRPVLRRRRLGICMFIGCGHVFYIVKFVIEAHFAVQAYFVIQAHIAQHIMYTSVHNDSIVLEINQ